MHRMIGDTAAQHGVPAHVLRHWEDVGILQPSRTGSGHRAYGPEHDSQIELVKCGKAAGLSLSQIATMLHGPSDERAPMLSRRLTELERTTQEIEAAKRLLTHALTCESPTSCPKCEHPRASFEFPKESGAPAE